jgi:Zn-dependent protease
MTCRPLFAFGLAAALILGGCVTIPLPPLDGEKTQAGDWGSIKIMVTYVPNITNLYNSYKEWKKSEQ